MNPIYFFIALYLVSALLMYAWVRIAHSPKGRFPYLRPDYMDYYTVFTPFVNTILCVYAWGWESPYKDK